VLYDLAGADERRRFSPYCWRIHLALKHKAYFRESREKRFGMSLEAYVAERDKARQEVQQALAPLRRLVTGQSFVCGDAAGQADHILFGAFQWARCTSADPLLAEGDAFAAWRERMLDLYDGYARSFPAR
jgi:glutathione S-transferase